MHHSLSTGLLFVGLVSCNAPQPPEATTPEAASDIAVMHPAVAGHQHLVPTQYQHQWELPGLERWDEYWQKQYATDTTGDLRIRTADLDGDGGDDHALFLCNTDTARRDSAYAIVVAFSNGSSALLASYPWAEYDGGIGMGLMLEPPGLLGHLGGEEGEEEILSPVELKQPAITVVFFEKASITWFWRNGAFHQVWTGD
jgi:hypothetical protein